MSDIIKSKGWDWKLVSQEYKETWKNPAIESFYLLNRWINQNKKDFLDLGCGLGRHTILFAKNGFKTFAFDISEEAINHTKDWALKECLDIVDVQIGDMLTLPYNDNSIDCILCRNSISHTNTKGIHKIISEIYRVLRTGGECYLTLGSKNPWVEQNWPQVDENTYLSLDKHEYKVPHFYADYDLVNELFKDFKIELIEHIGNFHYINDKPIETRHFHVLIIKQS